MADLLTESQHAQILAGVKSFYETTTTLSDLDISKIWGFGPVIEARINPKQASCVVLHDPTIDLPTPTNGKIDVPVGGDNWSITLNGRGRKRFKLKFHGPDPNKLTRRAMLKTSATAGIAGALAPHSAALASDGASQNATTTTPQNLASLVPDPANTTLICPPNTSPIGPLLGGDAIYNWQNMDLNRPRDIYWGTVAFVGGTNGKIKFRGDTTEVETTGKAISCAHVLYHQTSTSNIRSYRHPSGISYDQSLPDWPINWPSALPVGKWPDISTAMLDSTVVHRANEVRALGQLTGVKAPEAGDIVTKYGAMTGLTVARDIGMVWRRLPDEAGEFMLVRAVSNQFSRPGDSGAAVVHYGNGIESDDYRKLAGFILAGAIDDNEQYYLPVVEFSGTPFPAELNAVHVML